MGDEIATIEYLREQVRSISLLASDARRERDEALAELERVKFDRQEREDGWRLVVERLHADLAREEQAHTTTCEQRDLAEQAADRLAYAIASAEVIGEHSSANNPWANALSHLAGARADAEKHYAEAMRANDLYLEACSERDAARAEVERLRGALEPLSQCMRPIPGGTGGPAGGFRCGVCVGCHVWAALAREDGDGR